MKIALRTGLNRISVASDATGWRIAESLLSQRDEPELIVAHDPPRLRLSGRALMQNTRNETPTDEREAPHGVYGFERWGRGMVEVMDNGDVGLRNPLDRDAPPVSLPSIVSDLHQRGIRAPILLRISSFLEHEIANINEAFADAIVRSEYRGRYRGVFPVKVNQQAEVIRRIVDFGQRFKFGLEAGSKPELVIALAQPLDRDALVVCNGVKDEKFIRLAILSRKMDFNTVIVLESPRELETVIAVWRELGEEPTLGVRVKLFNRIGGNWSDSSGDRSVFGMNSDQLIEVIDRLKEVGLLHCLKFQHAHLGSQIPDINDVRRSVVEACRYFVDLTREGAPLDHLDLGGGLGFDYTGEKRAGNSSINYTVEEYCDNVVETVSYAMDEAEIDHPTLVTESGRAVAATSSMLIFDAHEATLYDSGTAVEPDADDHHYVSDLWAVKDYIEPRRLQECLNDAAFYRNELRNLFLRNTVGLRQMARAERIYLNLMARIKAVENQVDDRSDIHEQIENLSDIYHCNFSLFQSLPDVWAIGQLHPMAPLQRLDEEPTRRAILADITCDSDGKLDRFILADGVAPSLPVHPLREGEPYFIGVFFIGAYQETLGDLHNLFGDTNVVTIDLRDDGHFDLLEEVEGDTIHDVLTYVEFDPRQCIDEFRKILDRATSKNHMAASDRKALLAAYRDNMNGSTYYE